MNGARIVITTNGPGEFMGWVRPFVRAAYARRPDLEVSIVFVPCVYATGREAQTARAMFPAATVVDPKAYTRFLLGRSTPGMRRGRGALVYLGGDLFHATTVARRLGLKAMTYRFGTRSYRRSFVRFFALDEENAARLREAGAPPERVRVVGNLVPDAVLGSMQGPLQVPGVGRGVCILPGSRPAEVKHLVPFFAAAARDLARARPGVEISFVFSPFTGDEELRSALERAPDPAFGAAQGTLVDGGRAIEVDGARFAVHRSADYDAFAKAQLVITIPGTKCLEAAVLGRAMLVVLPRNRLDEAAVNGLAGYLHFVPVVGRPLKAWIARSVERGFAYVAQPNIEAGRLIAPELRGVLMPADIVAHASAMIDNPGALRAMGEALSRIYSAHVGAADRMAAEVVFVAEEATAALAGAV